MFTVPCFVVAAATAGEAALKVVSVSVAGAGAAVMGLPLDDGSVSSCCCGGCLLRLRRLKRPLMPFFTWATVSGATRSVSDSSLKFVIYVRGSAMGSVYALDNGKHLEGARRITYGRQA